jgi:hypothetical protein
MEGWSWGGLRWRWGGGNGIAWIEVVVVGGDGVADGFAPAFGAKGVGVFALGEMEGLDERLAHVGDGACEAGLDVAADRGGDEAGEGGVEVVGSEVIAGDEVGEVVGEFGSGLGLGFFLGVIEAEMRMGGKARSATPTAVFVGE